MTKLIQATPGPDGKGFGWRPDPPDKRDFPLSKRLAIQSTSALPRNHNFRDKMPPYRDQHNTSSCVGFSSSTATSYLRRVDTDRFDTIHSPLFGYYMARFLEDEVNETWTKVDAGAYIRLAIKAMNHTGTPPESKWPFIPDKINKKPIKSAFKQAGRWKLGAYYRCHNSTEVMNALAKGYPVVGGFTCYASMFTSVVEVSGDIPHPQPQNGDRILGYHAVCYCGFNQDTGRVNFQNSWGGWGDDGYGTHPLSWFDDRGLTDDMWALVGESDETNAAIRKPKT